jgi:hypothetical protein
MTPRPLLLTIATVALLAAGGCRTLTGSNASCHKQQEYQVAGNLPPLRMPVGLDGPDTGRALEIPELNTPELPLDPEGPCLDAPPALTEPPPPPSDVVLPERPGRGGDASAESGEQAAPEENRRQRRGRQPQRRPR